jgi:hydrogenase/urease accessory protein HupE
MNRITSIIVALIAALTSTWVQAHEVRPAFLAITQSDATHYSVVWKQPTQGEVAVRLVPHLSNGWLERAPDDQYAAGGFLVRTWNVASEQSPAGSSISIEGLEYTITDVLVQVRLLDRELLQTLLRPEHTQFVIEAASQQTLAAPVFLVHGMQHMLVGIDHLLFVLGLLLIVRNRWMLFKAISAFTVAHSITLAAAMIAKVSLAAPLVESLIALSILVLGVEVVHAQRGGTSLTIRYPWAVAFVFGLFHGMGFASGLAGFGMARHDLLAALVFFNLGVEVSQLAFIALVLLLGKALASLPSDVRGVPLMRVPAYVVGIAGAYWTFSTTAVLLGVTL